MSYGQVMRLAQNCLLGMVVLTRNAQAGSKEAFFFEKKNQKTFDY